MTIFPSAADLCAAQQPASPPDTVAIALADAPMFYLKDENRTPMRIVPSGTTLQLIAVEGRWCKVVFSDPRFGEEIGYMTLASVRLEPGKPGSSGGTGVLSQRGFLEGRAVGFPQEAPNDSVQAVGDALFREEVFVKPTRWFQLAAGLDLRANSHAQVEDEWRLDFEDRGTLKPRASVRRLVATVNAGRFTIDAGKQFIRWGRADILSPTDRFAPRDYMNVIDPDLLPVLGVRSSVQFGAETLEVAYLPRMTPSRMPLLDQRWTVPPPEAEGLTLRDSGSLIAEGSQQGVRWNHTGGRFEASVSFFDGFNHQPDIDATVDQSAMVLKLAKSYPDLRTYGLDMIVPTSLVTLKGEATYFTSPSTTSEEYVLYVLELERQAGQWLFDGGYAGEIVTDGVERLSFNAERGLARSFIGRAAYTADPRRVFSIEGAVRQRGTGVYVKGEYSQTMGRHWRMTAAGIVIAGDDDDFIGQYHRNSHLSVALRLSF